jgi:hypothetical protein
MTKQNNTINCPKCGEAIDVNDLLHHQIEDKYKEKYNKDLAKEKGKYEAQASQLNQDQEKFEAEKELQQEHIAKQVKAVLKQKELELKKAIKAEAEEEQSEAFDSLRVELEDKSSKIKELNKTAADFEKLKREKNELEEKLKAESAQELSLKLLQARETIQKNESEKNELKFKELEKQLEDQKKLTEEMRRKQEQGSMQTQGEAQELGIEEWLMDNFPLDTIQEIKKGERGADCLQIVHTRAVQNCGTIYYESKRTKVFQVGWIEKFKSDIREKGAAIGVLVTEAMPQDMDRLGMKDGIWICSFEEFKGLSKVLRESIVRINSAIVSQENKGDKMGMMYDFLTSNEFKLQIEAIVEGFSQMKSDLASEQRSMRSIWKKREKQIEKVLLNTSDMYGSIKGIAGNAIQSVPLLEFPSGEIDELTENLR